METTFESYIKKYLSDKYGDNSEDIYDKSYLLQYLVYKTKSANKGAKARGSFANLYAIYVIIEDYLNNGFDKNKKYRNYSGAQFSKLLQRQRELPFGEKLQNHALNSRMNEEFFKFFPTQSGMPPIMRNLETQRYWVNENYLIIKSGRKQINIAQDLLNLINAYIDAKQKSLKHFIKQCETLQNIQNEDSDKSIAFILSLLEPNVDARLFEIVSYAILKFYYKDIHKHIVWGFLGEKLTEDFLHLYKTGRTNANDGGIDFVMKPLGRFFQVTETLDFKKYFLDIDKVERYPLSFVIKSDDSAENLKAKIKEDAQRTYIVEKIVNDYLQCIEEIINIPILKDYLNQLNSQGLIKEILNEIILQSKVEFNYSE
jgi:hypothetical protein